ncbi:MAG: circularly permuted type 2 ATP-grasp protein, partial [Planctomycetales bacterium]|nr:circularly permuted type 2 ATP-grasp protein [Planctomycetales bacterium]
MNAATAAEEPFLRGYQPTAGIYDEAVGADGQLRPHWAAFIAHLEQMGRPEFERRWGRAERQIAIDDLTFSPHDSGETARPWILDAIPLLMEEVEWRTISAGLEQRARLFEMILSDLFGPQTLLKERLLPPDVLYGHPGYHPTYLGLPPAGGRYLQFYAADIVRAPDGRWWATGDRTRAPFGLGYVLENRIVASRTLPVAFRQCRVQRLAPFYVQLRETLRELAPRYKDNPRIVLLTKGPTSQSYPEDAYLARYLGYTLAEGGDLAVRENRVMLKTLSGLFPVEVLMRRLDDDDCDPVELVSSSAVGISGLCEVLRSGNVALANSLGARLVESPIFRPFLPGVCRHLLGEDLQTRSIATWWAGQKEALDYVLKRFDELLILPAYRMSNDMPTDPSLLTSKERDALIAQIRSQ